MLEPREALTKALTYFAETFPTVKADDLSIESLKLSDDKKRWITTLSFKKAPTVTNASSLELLFADKSTIELRTITIDAEDGSFISLDSPNTLNASHK